MPFFSAPFRFIVTCLDHLSYRWKFAVVAVVIAGAASVFLQQIYTEYRSRSDAIAQERAGLVLAEQAYLLLVDFQLHRGISYSAQMGSARFAEKLPAQAMAVLNRLDQIENRIATTAAYAPLQPSWTRLRVELQQALATTDGRYSAQYSFDTQTRAVASLLGWTQDIGDALGVTSDSNAAVFHLNLAQVRTIPLFVESVAELRGFASGLFLSVGDGNSAKFDLAKRVAAVEIAENAIHARIDRIATVLPENLSLKAPTLTELHAIVRYLKNTALLNAHQTGITEDPDDFFDLATHAITLASQIYQTQLFAPSLNLLDSRQDSARQRLLTHIATWAAVFLLVAILFAAMWASIRRAVFELNHASARFAMGDLDVRVSVDTQDELRHVGE